MHEAMPIGTVAGIPLRVHWSVLVILWLFAWSLASILPETAPGLSPAVYWVAGVVGAIALMASLMAHEVMHAVVARRAGVPVSGITLWLFGGVTRLGDEAPSARAELRIAASGPAVSLGLAAAIALLAEALVLLHAAPLVVGVAWWLSRINLVLGLFNLLPGAPLDGGRILCACLWLRHGDRVRAATSAARGGRILAYALIALGLLQFLTDWLVSGVWTVFIGWFLLTAARTEEDAAVTQQILSGVRVGDVMTPRPRTAPAWITVEDFIQNYLLGGHHSAYPVVERNGTVMGLLTLTQLRPLPPAQRGQTLVREAAIPLAQVPRTGAAEPLADLLRRLTPATGGRAVVTDGASVVGIVTARDVTRAIDVRQLALRG